MGHSIEFKPHVEKGLDLLPEKIHHRIVKAIVALADNPRPAGCKKLKTIDAYRIRVGDYRVIYEIKDAVLIILVVKIAHRREVYQ